MSYDKLQWYQDAAHPGSWYSILVGNPSLPGRYVLLNKVLKGTFNRPHTHQRAREIYVVQGTWWVGSGRVLAPDASVAKPVGSLVVHQPNEIHWDGAKADDVLLLIEGEGPATEALAN